MAGAAGTIATRHTERVNQPNYGTLIFLGEVADILEFFPQSASLAVAWGRSPPRRVPPQEFVAGYPESTGQIGDDRCRRICAFTLIVRDGPLSRSDGRRQLNLREAAPFAELDQAPTEVGTFALFSRHRNLDRNGILLGCGDAGAWLLARV